MNKKIKALFCAAMIACISAFASFAVGCGGSFDQLVCEHEYGEAIVTEAPTCSKKGKGEKTCTLCGKVDTESIDYLKHCFIYVEASEPTCTRNGIGSHIECKDCGFTETPPTIIPAWGHTVEIDKGIAASCETSGLTEGEHCSVCGYVFVKQTEVAATGHALVYVAKKSATCTETGTTAGEVCKDCGKVFKGCEEIPLTGHSYDNTGTCRYCGDYNDLYDDLCWTGNY